MDGSTGSGSRGRSREEIWLAVYPRGVTPFPLAAPEGLHVFPLAVHPRASTRVENLQTVTFPAAGSPSQAYCTLHAQRLRWARLHSARGIRGGLGGGEGRLVLLFSSQTWGKGRREVDCRLAAPTVTTFHVVSRSESYI